MSEQDETWEGRAVRLEAERDRALTVAETAMRIMTSDQLIEMRRALDKEDNGGQPGEAPERAAG